MLHAAHLGHGGRDDDEDGTFPATMSTCNSSTMNRMYNSINALPADDAAALNWQHNLMSKRQITANVGFEEGEAYWTEMNMAATTISSGGNGGPKFMNMFALSSPQLSYISQDVRIWHGRNLAPGTFRSKMHIKEVNASNTTTVRTQVLLKRMIDSGTNNTCDYLLNLRNPNNEQVSGGWVVVSASALADVQATGWKLVNSPPTKPKDAPNGQNLAGAHGYLLQYRVYGKSTTSGGANTSFRLDNARAERS